MLSAKGAVLTLVLGLSLLSATPAAANECSQAAQSSGQCLSITTDVSGGGVSVGASTSTPGTVGSTSGSGARSSWPPPPPREPVLGSSECQVKISGYCRAASPSKNQPQVVKTPPTPPTSARDLESFRPGSPAIVIEPGGWSIPRLPTNMYAVIGESRETGELLGWPIQVRFTPAQYLWGYGDGASATHSVAGGSWNGAQFSATTTSHTYSRPGQYRVSLQVGFEVAYRFDDGEFVGIPGMVWQAAAEQNLQVLTVTSLLVDQGCSPRALTEGRC